MAINNRAHDVLILGGGHAGVRAARELIRHQRPGERLDVALVSRDNVELWHGLRPQITSAEVRQRSFNFSQAADSYMAPPNACRYL
jgi:NADH dehydrogenase FAD-containing subunit